jgi:transcriptional regulator with XRE-family HTH domain
MVLSPEKEPYRTAHEDEEYGKAALRRVREAFGPELLDVLLKSAGALPPPWRDWAPGEGLRFVRYRLRFTQKELAGKAGLTQAQVSRAEGGAYARLDTWQRLYAAMGLELVMLPACARPLEELEKDLEASRPPGHWRLSGGRPRPRRKDRTATEKSEGPLSGALEAVSASAAFPPPGS